ncbi:MAG TPA: Ppx/GppA phosphatase family protein [Candidatus Dormibacteraeota bacterium]|nr:Ppx/GppA phosphatase family protein [Candidatus Dormibacteraeota bacterium]
MPTFAAVDIGSNSVRLKIARLQSGRLRALHEDREVTRLGEGVFGTGFLTPESMAETVKVLRRFHRATQQIVIDNVRVLATSALRDARNSQAFLEWVRSATGWRVEIVSGVEEARLIHLGLVSGARVDRIPTLMLDLGGGSCELTVSHRGHIRDAVSLPLGAVRLTNEFLRHDPVRKGEMKRLRGFVTREANRVVERIATARVRNVIATSGTAAALAAVARHMRRGRSGQRMLVTRAEMSRIAKRLARLPVAERRKIEGIGPRRAEIIVAGAVVYHELLDRLRLKGFRYSPLGLRDGILAQMAADYDRSTRSGRQIESERWESILKAVAHYHIDRKHAMDVREAATSLFTALRSVHRLPAEYGEWLSAAAMLYEVGDYVNRNGHHRHTHYIISNSEILGYTPQQRRVIAGIARYLGKSRPTVEDGPMKVIDSTDRGEVQKAIVLLRLARALNLGRGRAVEKVRVRVRAAEVTLTLVPRRRMGVDLELWAVEKERDYFREVFGRELSTAAS